MRVSLPYEHYNSYNSFFSFCSSDDCSPPKKQSRLIQLKEAVFTKEEQITFVADMLDIAAETATYLWTQLDLRLRDMLEWEEAHILYTLARNVTRNHCLYTLHQKHGRDVALPEHHRILHAPGAALYDALQT